MCVCVSQLGCVTPPRVGVVATKGPHRPLAVAVRFLVPVHGYVPLQSQIVWAVSPRWTGAQPHMGGHATDETINDGAMVCHKAARRTT